MHALLSEIATTTLFRFSLLTNGSYWLA